MITRTFLADEIELIIYFELLSKVQTKINHYLKEGTFVLNNDNNHKSYIKVHNTNEKGQLALREVYNLVTIETQKLFS